MRVRSIRSVMLTVFVASSFVNGPSSLMAAPTPRSKVFVRTAVETRHQADMYEFIRDFLVSAAYRRLTNDGTLEIDLHVLGVAPVYQQMSKGTDRFSVHVEEVEGDTVLRGYDTLFRRQPNGSWNADKLVRHLPAYLTVEALGLEHHFVLMEFPGAKMGYYHLFYISSWGISPKIRTYTEK